MIFVTRKIAQDQGEAVGPNDRRPNIIQPMQMDNLHTFRGDSHKISVFFFGSREKISFFSSLRAESMNELEGENKIIFAAFGMLMKARQKTGMFERLISRKLAEYAHT